MPPAGGRTTPPIFFPEKENGRCDRPKERRLIGSPKLEQPLCLRNATACVRRSRVSIARRFASASIIRCRSADLIEVQPNFRLSLHYSMRRAQQCRYFASSLPPSKRHSRLTTVRRGRKMVTYRRDSWRSHVHRTRLRSACTSSSYKLTMLGVEGNSPRPSLGDTKGVFSSRREYPL